MKVKKCSGCEQELPLEQFGNATKSNDGKQGYCKACSSKKQKEYYQKNKEKLIDQRQFWRNASKKNKLKDKEAYLRWKENNPESYKAGWQKYNRHRKLRVLDIVGRGKIACANCGCDVPDFLEVNHKSGGGSAAGETKGGNQKFYTSILNGSRSVDDLDIRCKPCNNLHFLELKYGPLPYKIIWEPTNEQSSDL